MPPGRRHSIQQLYRGRTYAFIRRAIPAPPVVEANFSKAIVRDAPRTAIPEGAVYDSADFLLHQAGLAMKRGGTSYAGPALTSATYAQAVKYANFPAGAKVVAVGDNGHIYTVTSGTTTDVGGSTVSTVDTPKLRVGGGKNLLIIPNSNGTGGPIKYDGSAAPAALGGTPSAGKFCAIYKTRLVLANTNANPNRMFFSPTPDPETTWDTTNSWVDADNAISGLAALQNSLLVFSQDHLERIIGSNPPPGSDMDRAPIADIGCTDARSIVVQEGNVVFANPRGVYLTSGGIPESLTSGGLIDSYWQSLLSGYDPSTWTISSGILRSFLIVSVLDNTGALKATLMCYLPRRSWWRLTNIKATMFSTAFGAQEELYYADRSTNRIVTLSGIFSPASGNKNDANGTAVTPVLETRMLGHGVGVKHFDFGRLSYDMRDAASDLPTLAVQIGTGVEATTYAAVSESPFAATSDEIRQRFTLAKVSQGVSVKLTQSNASSKTEIYGLEYSERALPSEAGGQ